MVDEWQIDSFEEEYIDRQQGEQCLGCRSNLRSIVLATALNAAFRNPGTFEAFVSSPQAANLSVLEINTAGTLHPYLARMPGLVFGTYPEVDMHALPYPDETFDAVVHSDTLEHVTNPVHALRECRRVLKKGGSLCFTVPIIVGRLTRDRTGLPKSYHGDPDEAGEDWSVQTEFGADAWTSPLRAGFSSVQIFALDFPAATAMSAIRTE